ncbi:protein PcrA [Bifidobacterium adolescentis]|nr:protein PcrA [Bifidobacterium adolescentis]SPU24735.1 protein PcrA [Bifidobacterium adolescentis]
MTGHDTGDANAGSLNGQNLIDGLALEMLGPSGAHMVEQLDIALMVEERVHFQHIAGFDGTLLHNALFKLLHETP